jgi:rubrerythrin
MKEMTEANLKAAFAGESQAHVRYLNFAEKARREKLPNIARLFEAAAFSEQVHASNHLRKRRKPNKTLSSVTSGSAPRADSRWKAKRRMCARCAARNTRSSANFKRNRIFMKPQVKSLRFCIVSKRKKG